jgi:dihydroorotase
MPGVIDDQVHFREPGLTHKGDIASESAAAAAGGITSYMEMPNTNPQTVTQELLEEKYRIAGDKSAVNYSFYMGATNSNFDELKKTDPTRVCGIKIFMGSSTGNMLVDDDKTLSRIFAEIPMLMTTHCEDEATIKANLGHYKSIYGENIDFGYHHLIRSSEACYKSSAKAASLAHKYGTRLHILHLSSKEEMSLLEPGDITGKNVTGEVCVHHLWFSNDDYPKFGSRIKWNPAIKTAQDRDALRKALNENRLDVVATDHAPHTLEEKNNTYLKAPSGGPLVQHSLVAMLEMVKQEVFTYEKVVEKMCHAPAKLFGIKNRGFIREGFKADLVVVSPSQNLTVAKDNILYKCRWSPFEGTTFSHKVIHTFVNGRHVYNDGVIDNSVRGERLLFNR